MTEAMFSQEDILEAVANTAKGINKILELLDEHAPVAHVYEDTDGSDWTPEEHEINDAMSTLYSLRETIVDSTIIVMASLASEFDLSDEDKDFIGAE